MWRVAITVFRPYRPRLGDTLGRAFEGGAVFEIVLMQMTKTMTKTTDTNLMIMTMVLQIRMVRECYWKSLGANFQCNDDDYQMNQRLRDEMRRDGVFVSIIITRISSFSPPHCGVYMTTSYVTNREEFFQGGRVSSSMITSYIRDYILVCYTQIYCRS